MKRHTAAAITIGLALGGCGGAPPEAKSVTVVRAPAPPPKGTPSASASVPAPPADPHVGLALEFETKVAGAVRGIALEDGRLYVNVGGALRVFDRHGPVAAEPSSWKPGDPLVVVGDGAFDPRGFGSHAPAVRRGTTCEARAFSYDASRMSADCQDASGDAVYVYDTRTGAEIGVFTEFHTAAPIRTGAITSSGNFVFWWSRASGAFEEIKSHVTGPMMSSHSVMSRDETMIFTTVDRTWFTQDTSPARVLDPKNGRTRFLLGRDVDTVFFSPSSRLFAAHHSANWADLMRATQPDHAYFTIHADGPDALARVPEVAAGGTSPARDAVEAAFAPDDSAVAVRFASGVVRVYSIRR